MDSIQHNDLLVESHHCPVLEVGVLNSSLIWNQIYLERIDEAIQVRSNVDSTFFLLVASDNRAPNNVSSQIKNY